MMQNPNNLPPAAQQIIERLNNLSDEQKARIEALNPNQQAAFKAKIQQMMQLAHQQAQPQPQAPQDGMDWSSIGSSILGR